MKREDIEKAAKRFYFFAAIDLKEKFILYRGFKDGAKWRIDIVWHDVSERPDENEPTIIELGNNKFSFHDKGYKGPWKYNIEQFEFRRWAYIKDLIP